MQLHVYLDFVELILRCTACSAPPTNKVKQLWYQAHLLRSIAAVGVLLVAVHSRRQARRRGTPANLKVEQIYITRQIHNRSELFIFAVLAMVTHGRTLPLLFSTVI